MISVPASELEKNFDVYERKAAHEPIEVTHVGRRSSYLVSEQLFKDMMMSYRRAMPASALSEDDVALIEQATVQTDKPYNLDDIPDVDGAGSHSV